MSKLKKLTLTLTPQMRRLGHHLVPQARLRANPKLPGWPLSPWSDDALGHGHGVVALLWLLGQKQTKDITQSPSATNKIEEGLVAWLHTFLQMYASGGYIPPEPKPEKRFSLSRLSRFTILHRSFRGLPKDGNDKSIQHRGANSMTMSYHIDQNV